MLDAPTAVETRMPRLGLTAGEVVPVDGSMVPLIASGRRPGLMPAGYAFVEP